MIIKSPQNGWHDLLLWCYEILFFLTSLVSWKLQTSNPTNFTWIPERMAFKRYFLPTMAFLVYVKFEEAISLKMVTFEQAWVMLVPLKSVVFNRKNADDFRNFELCGSMSIFTFQQLMGGWNILKTLELSKITWFSSPQNGRENRLPSNLHDFGLQGVLLGCSNGSSLILSAGDDLVVQNHQHKSWWKKLLALLGFVPSDSPVSTSFHQFPYPPPASSNGSSSKFNCTDSFRIQSLPALLCTSWLRQVENLARKRQGELVEKYVPAVHPKQH